MISYFIKSTSCLALLLLFYHLILEREKMHQFNRFYLLGSVVFSFLAPLFIIYIKIPVEKFKKTSDFFTSEVIETTDKTTNYVSYFLILTVLVSSVLLIRFVKNIFTIYQKAKGNSNVKHQKAILVLVEDAINPHTFWNYIFINKEAYHSQKIEKELFTHELTHALQKHTLDVLFIEFLKIIFWFNPIFYFLKRTIQLNHEFLADTKVIANHKNISEYQYLLLDKTTRNHEYYLASNLNYLLTKKRLLMMTKQSSRTSILIKKLAIIPVIAGLTFLFAQKIEAKETTIKTIFKTDINKNNSFIYQKKKHDSLFPAPLKRNKLVIPPPPPPKANFPKGNMNDISNIPTPICRKITKQSEPKYYLDGKLISKKKMDLINPKNIKSVNVKKNKNRGAIYITSNISKPVSKKITKQSEPKYYLNEKLISKAAADKIAPENIKSVNVKKNKKTGGSVYIISHKKQ